jgi:hypothetical protein
MGLGRGSRPDGRTTKRTTDPENEKPVIAIIVR